MNSENTTIKIAPFQEYLAVPLAQSKNQLFDIIIEDKFSLSIYCDALIEKIFSLRQSQFPAFINYQCTLVTEPLVWINKLEKLLANNEAFFASKTAMSRYNKLYTLIDKKRTELESTSLKDTKSNTPKRLINADSEDRHFSFHETKLKVEKLENFNDKIIFLTEEIFDYEEADIISKNKNLDEYNVQCEKLKVRLQTTRKLLLDIEKEKLENDLKANSEIKPAFKIRLNGPINILTDAYKQMMNEVKPNGKPYIEHKIKEIAKFICDNYLDEKGKELSIQTIQTYLSPTRTDKNPNNDWKIKL
ncbi:hypothetical protein [Flavobacterium sp.]|uniref:hypothetical protein n=1 Tax=Flavobacterium sp. TaxID=239 RepID=UPI0037531F25